MISKNTPLKEVLQLASPCRCDACNHGCRLGSGKLAGDDLKHIAKFLNISEKELISNHLEEVELFNKKIFKPRLLRKDGKNYGQCVFYDETSGCTIHEVKPLECKTSIQCKDYGEELSIWFMVNHVLDAGDPESIRQYAQYLKSGGKTIKLAELKDIVPDQQKLNKILSYEILK